MFSKDKIAYIFLIFATLFWSGNFIVGKAASLFEIPPFTLNFYRWTFAWLILAPFTLNEILKKKNYILENIKLLIILGISSITVFNSIVYYSLNDIFFLLDFKNRKNKFLPNTRCDFFIIRCCGNSNKSRSE